MRPCQPWAWQASKLTSLAPLRSLALGDSRGRRGGAWPVSVAVAPDPERRSAYTRPWSFPWSLSERISHHLRASQGRSHALRDLRTGPGRGLSPVSPITGECRKAPERRGLSPVWGVSRGARGPAVVLRVRAREAVEGHGRTSTSARFSVAMPLGHTEPACSKRISLTPLMFTSSRSGFGDRRVTDTPVPRKGRS